MKTILKVEALNKWYKNLHAVNHLNLHVVEGQIFGMIGPNGAGKTTSIECILGMKSCDYESIELLNQPIKRLRKTSKRHKMLFSQIGVQFQNNFYPDLIKVNEMCKMMSSLYEDVYDWKELLVQFKIESKQNTLVSQLSGGQRQRLSVLLALINKPKLVFLDELTTGLDPQVRREVWMLLKKLNQKGLTIFLTSHFMDEVEYLCDEIVILNNGIVCEQGSPQEIVSKLNANNLETAYLSLIEEENKNENFKNTI